jgi:hypothetical protein
MPISGAIPQAVATAKINNRSKPTQIRRFSTWHAPCNARGIGAATTVHKVSDRGDTAMTTTNSIGARLAAIALTVIVSTTMVLGAVGPATAPVGAPAATVHALA